MEIKLPPFPGNKPIIMGIINVKINDRVKKNQVLANVETSKGIRNILAPKEGFINKIRVSQGDRLRPGQVLFYLEVINTKEKAGESNKDLSDFTSKETSKKELLETDLLVIGAGVGGYSAAIYGKKSGLDVILVEEDKLGGTCLNFGCIPTKTLIHSANIYHDMKSYENIGINCKASLDYLKLQDHKDEIVKNLVAGISYLIEKNDITFIKGHAEFLSNNTVCIGESEIKAKNIIIATGARLDKGDFDGANLSLVLDAKEALGKKDIPQSITIIGGGVMGMEFAFLYNNLGSKVSVLAHREVILRTIDSLARDEIYKRAKERGIDIYLNSPVKKIEKSLEDKAIVNFIRDGKEEKLISQNVLITAKTPANTDNLGLNNTSIDLDKETSSIRVNEFMQSSVEHIYAIGDCNGIYKLAHVAIKQAKIALDAILGKKIAFDKNKVPLVIFTSPEIASIGYSEDELRTKNISFTSKILDFSSNGKSIIDDNGKGFIKILVDEQSHKILGASIVGKDISNLISHISLAMENSLTIENLSNAIFPHPTISEIIGDASLKVLGLSIND